MPERRRLVTIHFAATTCQPHWVNRSTQKMFARWVVAVVGLTHAWRHRPKRTLTPDRYPNNVMLFWLYQTGNISQFALDPHAVQVSAVAEALAGGD